MEPMQEKKPELILCGSIAIDRIMNFNGKFAEIIQPDKLHVLSLSVLLEQLVDTPGGIAANIAYSLGLLGDSPVLLGSVGKPFRRTARTVQRSWQLSLRPRSRRYQDAGCPW